MFEYPLSRAASVRRVRRGMTAQSGFLALFALLFFLNGGPPTNGRPRSGPDLPALPAAVSSSAAAAQEVERLPPVSGMRVGEEAAGGLSEPSASWTLALRSAPLFEPEPAVVRAPLAPAPAPDVALPSPPDVPAVNVPLTFPAPVRAEALQPRASLATLAGRWMPDGATCRASADVALIPLEFGRGVAKAGGATCRFGEPKGEKNRWSVLASCSSGAERWTANVKLALVGSRLTWASERGSQGYKRCPVSKVAAKPAKTAKRG